MVHPAAVAKTLELKIWMFKFFINWEKNYTAGWGGQKSSLRFLLYVSTYWSYYAYCFEIYLKFQIYVPYDPDFFKSIRWKLRFCGKSTNHIFIRTEDLKNIGCNIYKTGMYNRNLRVFLLIYVCLFLFLPYYILIG